MPDISVVMSVRNGARYLPSAIDSVLAQSYADFELIVIDDGSLDDSRAIVRGYSDERIRLVPRAPRGLTASLNEGIAMSRGRYIARHDADDVSHPTRFEMQVEALEREPSLGVVGSNCLVIDEHGTVVDSWTFLCEPADVRLALLVSNPLVHGSVMARREVMSELGGYDARWLHVEDYELWVRASRRYDIKVLPDYLYSYRRHDLSVSASHQVEMVAAAASIAGESLDYFLAHRRSFRVLGMDGNGYAGGPLAYRHAKASMLNMLARRLMEKGQLWRSAEILCLSAVIEPHWRKNYKCLVALLLPPLRSRWIA